MGFRKDFSVFIATHVPTTLATYIYHVYTPCKYMYHAYTHHTGGGGKVVREHVESFGPNQQRAWAEGRQYFNFWPFPN